MAAAFHVPPNARRVPSYDFSTQNVIAKFRSVVKDPCFISSHNGVQKLISFLCVAREKLERGTHPYRFVIVR